MKKIRFFLLFAAVFLLNFSLFAQQKGYYRFPAIHDNEVVFTAEGDLWKFDLSSHVTLRLTTGLGLGSHASISPDGSRIAFVGQYEGPSEVYVMPSEGGVPKRLTYEESSPIVYQWTKDGKILYSTNYYSTIPNAQLAAINPDDMSSTLIPLSQADQGTYALSGELFFTRMRDQGSHTKRYKGGTAQSLWKFDGINEAMPLTADYTGTSKNPMYYDGRIYFLTDRDGTMNIWSMNTDGKDLKQLTFISGFDLEDADIWNDKIVCQKGADIMLYDISSGKSEILDIKLISDFAQRSRQWITDPKSKITAIDLSYSGDQVAITSRGRVFSFPADGRRWSEVTRKYGIRYKDASYLNKSNEIMMLSDESGEFELWKADNYGFKSPVQVTSGSKDLIQDFSASPDGNYVVYNEKDNRLLLFKKSTGKSILIGESRDGFSGPYSWSSDSKWIAFTDRGENLTSYLCLYNVETGKTFQVTDGRLESYNPRFSPDNKWLYFISERTFGTAVGSPWGSRQPEPFYDRTAKIYALALDPAAKFPFVPENELSSLKSDTTSQKAAAVDRKKAGQKKADEKKAVAGITIDFEGLQSRLYQVPMKASNIADFRINDSYIYWLEYDTRDYSMSLKALKINSKPDNETVSISDNVSQFTFSGDGKKVLIRDKNGIYVLGADGSKPDIKKNTLNIENWAFTVDPVEDWKQMFIDAWRMERDYFYDRNMHGVDWTKVRDQYMPLVDRVTDRYELDDLLSQMISELSALHMFVYDGDKRQPQNKISNGYLGAMLTKDASQGGYVINHIFKTDPDFPESYGPLAKPELKIKEGDVIIAVNGVSTLDVNNLNELLLNKANTQVRLKLSDSKGVIYEEVVTPVSSDSFSSLRYSEWEYTRRLEVEKESDNRIGYIHLRAMGGNNYDDFVKGFYPVFNKEGLIIDVRHNRGGNIDSWILEKLLRKAWFYWAPRVGVPTSNMQYAFTGHVVVLMDERTASDGEAFSEGFRRLGLGKLIGMRTWGGEIWLSSGNRLVDNGIATAAETGVYSPDGQWLIEGVGAIPDIQVDNLPNESFKGKDAQLEAAIEYLKKLIKEEPVTVPPVPKYPDKSADYNRK